MVVIKSTAAAMRRAAARAADAPSQKTVAAGSKPAQLEQVLAATGYMPDGQPATGLRLGAKAQAGRLGRAFVPDAAWRSAASLAVYFKYEPSAPAEELVAEWLQEIWNEANAPLLWVVCPESISLYNGFGPPNRARSTKPHLIRRFGNTPEALRELNTLAGLVAVKTGHVWEQASEIDNITGVEEQLLGDLIALEWELATNALPRKSAQALLMRVVILLYLVHRRHLGAAELKKICGLPSLSEALRSKAAAEALFAWLADTFHGDIFPPTPAKAAPLVKHLRRVADFIDGIGQRTSKRLLFPYRFDVLPVEFIGILYQQFTHLSKEPPPDRRESMYMLARRLPHSVPAFVIDKVTDGAKGQETALDLTCGTGAFLTHALRRLVALRSPKRKPSKALIKSTLTKQLCGVDKNETSLRLASVCLHLTALELAPDPQPLSAQELAPLLGKTLFLGDARQIDTDEAGKAMPKRFDLIVGNPPPFMGDPGTRRLNRRATPYYQGLGFLRKAAVFSHAKTRFGLLMSVMEFFELTPAGGLAAHPFLGSLGPTSLFDFSSHRLWPSADGFATTMMLLAQHKAAKQPSLITTASMPPLPGNARVHTFEPPSRQGITFNPKELGKQPWKLRAATRGNHLDLALMAKLTSAHRPLGKQLANLGVRFSSSHKSVHGLRPGGKPMGRKTLEAALEGVLHLDRLGVRDMGHFRISRYAGMDYRDTTLPSGMDMPSLPLLVIKTTTADKPRLMTAVLAKYLLVSQHFTVLPMPAGYQPEARLLAAIMSSSLATWCFGLSASDYDLRYKKLSPTDFGILPVPDLSAALITDEGRLLLRLEDKMRSRGADISDWVSLDGAVCSLYGLNGNERLIVQDGLQRNGPEWGRKHQLAAKPSSSRINALEYARTLLAEIQSRVGKRDQGRVRAEVIDLPRRSPLRLVRLVREEQPMDSGVNMVAPQGDLSQILADMDERLNVRVQAALSEKTELRVHGKDEVLIIKPGARRHWLCTNALVDADLLLEEK
ncbi:MAG: hypothetical protein ACR2PJ_01270, partial [Pseudomonadales bacterium]